MGEDKYNIVAKYELSEGDIQQTRMVPLISNTAMLCDTTGSSPSDDATELPHTSNGTKAHT
jgi:hypothetical protein